MDDSVFDKKVIKLWKAMRLMEQSKHLEPKFSESFKELAKYLNEFRVSNLFIKIHIVLFLEIGGSW